MGASESKLAFKQSIFLLAGQDEISPSDPLWAQLYTLPESAEDVFALWSPNDLRALTLNNGDVRPPQNIQVAPKKNLETLIYTVIARLQTLQTRAPQQDVQVNTVLEALNCMRILTRLLPYVYEAEHLRDWQDTFFWQPRTPTPCVTKRDNRPTTYVDGLDPTQTFSAEHAKDHIGVPLGETLLECVLNYFFFPGFTIPKRVREDGSLDIEVLVKVWQTGIGSNKSLNCTKENEKCQMESLRLLIALSSRPMYTQPSAIVTLNVQPLTYMTTRLEGRVVNGIVCSLLNTILKYNPNAWNLPIDLTTTLIDPKKSLVTCSLQLLLLLLAYQIPSGLPERRNAFRHALSMLHRPDDFQFIQQGLSQVLSHPISGNLNYFQNKDKALPWAPEMLSLFWELIQCNKRFRRYLIETGCALDYVILLLFYAIDSKDHSSRHGTLRLCVFALQSLSTDPSFAKKLNVGFPHSETLPVVMRVPNFHGSYADFLICSIYTIFSTPKSKLDAISPALVGIIHNVAPYQANLARATSSKIMDLFTMLSSPNFLLANDRNHELLSTLLDAINGILENQLNTNRRFVDVLVGSRARFKALRALTIEGALVELDRHGQDRKDRGLDANEPQSQTRQSSVEYMRGSQATRSTFMDDLSEDGRFSVGEDDELTDNDVSGDLMRSAHEGGNSDSATLPMSEKARGKRPAPRLATASRTTSTSSLPTVATIASQPFRPSQEWLETWYGTLPLATIFKTINDARTGGDGSETRAPQHAQACRDDDNQDSSAIYTFQRGTSIELDETSATKYMTHQVSNHKHKASAKEIPATLPTTEPGTVSAEPPRPFEWTTIAVIWYTAELWGRIYIQEAEASQGVGGLYSGTNIVLFKRSSSTHEISLRSPKGAIDAVGNSLAQRFSSISLKREG